ncbi:hypothetical protein NX794_24820 [Streptomyces sp. LP11]|uniref:XRE family transcriptional regulator n=1 Tax=Streptomyces pyxinicus TaxID=2970331 RepID=A0ABT2B7B9_9ACTN|nr:hypothetical protein [Streptomyces sp. LP11]MCS0604409.1 hypothetical protein [Streptomyces sp. LP11]
MALSDGRTATGRAVGEAQLREALRTGPFSLALHTALSTRGLALHRVRERLSERGIQVGVTTLSYWQRGVRHPGRLESLRVVAALEDLLGLPEHALTRLLEPRDTKVHPAGRRYSTMIGSGIGLVLAQLGAPQDGGLHTVMQSESVTVDARRRLASRESQQVLRAHREDVDRYLAVHVGEQGCATERVDVTGLVNCRLGRVRRNQEAGLVAAELLFDTRLRAGDTTMVRYRFHDGTGEPCREYSRGFLYAGSAYALQIAFDRAALPVRCRSFTQTSVSGAPAFTAELTLNAHGTVHLFDQETDPGLVGVCWDWE